MNHITSKMGATAFALFLSQSFLTAADLTWDGAAGAPFNWSDSNWGGAALSDGDHITLSGSTGTANVNDTTGFSLGSITVEGSSTWDISNATSVSGNGFSLSGGISNNLTSGSLSIRSDITLTAAQTISTNSRAINFLDSMTLDIGDNDTVFHTTGGGLYLKYGNELKGSGTVTKTGAGNLELGHSNYNFTGDIVADEGLLHVLRSNALGSVAGTTRIADGASLLFQVSASVDELITVSGSGYAAQSGVRRGAMIYQGEITHTQTVTLGGASTDFGFRVADHVSTMNAGLDEETAGSGVVKLGSYRDPSAGFLRYNNTDVTYTGTTTVKGGGLIVDVNHGSAGSRVAGYDVTYEFMNEADSGVTGGVTSQSTLAGDGTVFLAADEQITISGFDGSLLALLAPGTITEATDVADFTSTIGSFTVDAGNAAAGVTLGDNSAYLAQIGAAGTSDLLEIVNGTLTITGSATLILDGTLEDGQVYTLAEYNSITGTFATISGLDAGWGVNYGVNELTLSQIPEPAAFVSLLGLAALTFVGIRRRGAIAS